MFTEAKYVTETQVKAFNGSRWVDYDLEDPTKSHHSINEFIAGGGTMPEVQAYVAPTVIELTVDEQREQAYKLEADMLYLAYQGQLEDTGEAEEAKAAWVAKRQEIKTLYPKT